MGERPKSAKYELQFSEKEEEMHFLTLVQSKKFREAIDLGLNILKRKPQSPSVKKMLVFLMQHYKQMQYEQKEEEQQQQEQSSSQYESEQSQQSQSSQQESQDENEQQSTQIQQNKQTLLLRQSITFAKEQQIKDQPAMPKQIKAPIFIIVKKNDPKKAQKIQASLKSLAQSKTQLQKQFHMTKNKLAPIFQSRHEKKEKKYGDFDKKSQKTMKHSRRYQVFEATKPALQSSSSMGKLEQLRKSGTKLPPLK